MDVVLVKGTKKGLRIKRVGGGKEKQINKQQYCGALAGTLRYQPHNLQAKWVKSQEEKD